MICYTDNHSAWRTDEEFGREMLAGVNPVLIRRLEVHGSSNKYFCLESLSRQRTIWEFMDYRSSHSLFRIIFIGTQEFPPKSKLNRELYGDQNSKITEEHIQNSLDGLNIDEVMLYLY
jgi:linoleate 9S-lipoxygenase